MKIGSIQILSGNETRIKNSNYIYRILHGVFSYEPYRSTLIEKADHKQILNE